MCYFDLEKLGAVGAVRLPQFLLTVIQNGAPQARFFLFVISTMVNCRCPTDMKSEPKIVLLCELKRLVEGATFFLVKSIIVDCR